MTGCPVCTVGTIAVPDNVNEQLPTSRRNSYQTAVVTLPLQLPQLIFVSHMHNISRSVLLTRCYSDDQIQ